MYDVFMKAIVITIPEELDRQAAAEAKQRGISKSELIRHGLTEVLRQPAQHDRRDLWVELSGFARDVDPIEPVDIDRVLYGG